MILDSIDNLGLEPSDLRSARRFNSVLAAMPRFHTSRRWNARLINTMLKLHRTLPPLRRWSSRVSSMPIPGSSASIRLMHPGNRPSAMLLHFHGGAWVMGSARLEDRLAARIASDCGLLVAAVEFPNAIDDGLDLTLKECLATAHWVIENLQTFGVDQLILSGESSGAHLALESLLSLRSNGQHSLVRGFYSVCGAFDLEGSQSLHGRTGHTLLIDAPSALKNLRRLTPSLPPSLSRGPLHAELHNLPPALFIAGSLDPIVNDSFAIHANWSSLNGNASLAVVPQGPHGFNRMPTRLASKTNAFGRRWLSAQLKANSVERSSSDIL